MLEKWSLLLGSSGNLLLKKQKKHLIHNLKMKQTRQNKTKEQIAQEMQRTAIIKHQSELAKKVFPLIKESKSIYDAQTVVNAAAGYIKFETNKATQAIKVKDVLDGVEEMLKLEKKSVQKTMVENIVKLLIDEPANDVAMLLESFGKTLSQYSAAQFLKTPMSEVKMKDIIA
jgi:hypothetical protein